MTYDYREDSAKRGIKKRWQGKKPKGRKPRPVKQGKAEEIRRQKSLDATELAKVW